ncbi:MAG TPA: hypothetical protein VNE39_12205 [Planctomycetota bacterium]|nr:hypothetical protein [Planctomycetota bacterium]
MRHRMAPPRCRGVLGTALAAVALALLCPAAAAATREVIVVFKTHFDIGYTAMARDVVAHYRTGMIDRALKVCDDTRALPPENRFVWTLPGWPMAQLLGPAQTPDRRTRILDAVREGRLVTHALPGTLHTESLDLEDLVRGMRFSSELARSLGQPLPRDAKMTDVPSHNWILPTVLVHAGVEFLHVGCNAACPTPDVSPLFWWEGPDGSRLLTMYAGDYGTGLRPPANWPHATWLALIHTGDNQGPPNPNDVRALLDRAAREMPGVKIRFGRLSDFADAIRREKPELPVIRADMPDTWVHGIMSMPIETKIMRNVRPTIMALESLNTLLRIWGVDVPSAKDTVAAAYERSLMYSEHTWGLDFKAWGKRLYGAEWGAAHAKGVYKRAEESWAEHGAYIRQAEAIAAPALDANLQALARAVNVQGPRIVVYNPLPWVVDDIVSVRVPGKLPEALAEAGSGEQVPMEREGDTVRFLASGLWPMGYCTYVPGRPSDAAGDLVASPAPALIENRRFRVRLDPSRGAVASLFDKLDNVELVDPNASFGLGQYLYERFDADQVKAYLNAYLRQKPGWAIADLGKNELPPAREKPYAAASPKNMKLEITRTPLAVRARMSAPATDEVPHAVSVTVALYPSMGFVDFEWSVTGKKREPWPEAGWFCFPVKVDQPKFRIGRLGSIVDPTTDFRRSASHDCYCVNTGLTVEGPNGRGVGLCGVDTPLVSLERPGLWRYSRDFVPTKPYVFFNLFNNAISTNFQQWVGGSWSVRVRLWRFERNSHAVNLVGRPWQARQVCRAGLFDGPPGALPVVGGGVWSSRQGASRDGLLVIAFGPNPDGDGLLLRLWEQSGDEGPCDVHLPKGLRPKSAQPCDLRGRPIGEAIPVRDGKFTVPMSPFAPVSLLLR